MRILSNTTVDTTVNNINLATLNSTVSSLSTNKADNSDLPTVSEDQVSGGNLTNIDVSPSGGTIIITFEAGQFEISNLTIS